MIWYQRDCSSSSRRYGERLSVDAPMETVTTVGLGGAGAGGGDWYWYRTDGRSEELMPETSDKTRVLEVDPNDAAPTVMAAGIGDAKYSQAYLVDGKPPDGKPPDGKPPYRIPLMSEIAAVASNGLSIVSTFSGCGGSCLGFKMAGYRVLWANEFVPAAQATYRANHPQTVLDTSDIRTVTAATIRAVIGDIDLDVFEGSPPCASFSTAGKQQKGWGKVRKYSDTTQRTDDLFEQYVRLVDELRPRAFVAENVAGMTQGVGKMLFNEYWRKMNALPYNVEAMVLDAQHLGVPQRRRRVIFIGVRKDVGAPRWPVPLLYCYSVRDAIPWIGGHVTHAVASSHSSVRGGDPHGAQFEIVDARIEGSHGFDGHAPRSIDAPSETITSSRALSVFERIVEPESALGNAVGGEWDKLKPGQQSEKYMSLILPTEDDPCPTVTALGGTSAASVAHPYERRKFSIAELRRICGFPDDFILTGSYAQQWERLGRAVPPPMMAAVAAALVPVLRRPTT